MKLHVLVIPSWYATPERPVHGTFFSDQARAVQSLGHTVGVVYPELYSLANVSGTGLRHNWLQVSESVEGELTTFRTRGWRIPRMKRSTEQLWVRQAIRLAIAYQRKHGAVDVIHAHCVHNAGVAAAQLKARLRIPFVITEHFSGYERDVLRDDQLISASDVFHSADAIATVSEALKDSIKGYTRSRDVRVIPNLVNTDGLTMPPTPRTTDGAFVFFSLGFLTEVKGYDIALRALAIARERGANIRLMLGGDGDLGPELRGLCSRLGMDDFVEFTGLLNREQIIQRCWSAHAFLSSSRTETFGVAIIEGMATGLPVLATRSGGPESYLTPETGILVPTEDAEAMATAMAGMMHARQEWTVRGAAIRESVQARFDSKVVGARIVDMYLHALEQRRGR